ncbi:MULTISPECIES: methionyl-tRNA formyltransferase [Cupriavidus]|jgi:methionyl-tRNA formyltransferase|uniref:Formyl transferase n=1 Tax=Cupriavidus metallidurans TaxID=119219 RepID=A0A482IZT7_9BURK|nr:MULTISPECIES: formyltransferase family protein [Cupriavidus]KWR81596.1 formyl transferase [Cupriavidus sp. SHE]QBP12917.1 formyl transferase [Cupriavidus metallidurans]QWC90708.1 formyl transferase [Cupriavidus metallidurans]
MRFAFAGFDLWCGVFDAFVAQGWQPLALFTMPVDNQHDFNEQVVSRAQSLGIPVHMSPIRSEDLRALRDQQCEVLVVAGHGWKIPDWTHDLHHAINFHPSPLPEGRGPYPLFRAVMEDRRDWAVTCHRVSPAFDAGDILAAEPVLLTTDECHETLQLKLQLAARKLATRVASDFRSMWNTSQPQSGGSYWPKLTDADRTLDFTGPVAEILRLCRAFGQHECIAHVGAIALYVRHAAGWPETHDYLPGTVVHHYRRSLVVAARDGFIALLDWSALPPPTRALNGL